MGSRGYVALRFRGRYYTFYSQYDSHPHSLGDKLIKTIPIDPEEYSEWLQRHLDRLALWNDTLYAKALCIQDDELQSLEFNRLDYAESRYCGLLDERLEYTPAYEVPQWGDEVDFTYVMDFDREVFTLDNEVHFYFRKIPRSCWLKSLSIDGSGGRTPIPRLVPKDSLASLVVRGDDMHDDLASINDMPVEFVNPKGLFDFSRNCRSGPVTFMCQVWDGFRQKLEVQMRYTLFSILPTDFVFREVAFGIVSFAASLSGAIRFEDNRRCKGPLDSDYKAIVCGESIENPAIVVSKLAYGYHKEGIEPGSAPQESTYWFRGVLIHLSAHAWDREGEAAIANAIKIGRTTVLEPDSFDILLISIDFVIIVRVFEDSIQRTEPLTLLDIPVHYPALPEDRYSEEARGNIPNWYESQDGTAEPQLPYRRRTRTTVTEELAQTFCAMVHLFESSVISKLRPEKEKEGIFPTELYEMILKHAVESDARTHRACLLVSRKFRRICLESISLSDDVLLRGCSQTNRRGSHRNNASQPVDHGLFEVLGRDTGVTHTTEAVVGKDADENWRTDTGEYFRESEDEDWTGFTVICGAYPRLSFLSDCCFSCFDAPDPWEGRQLHRPNEPVNEVSNTPNHDPVHEGPQGVPEHYWQAWDLKNYYKLLKQQKPPYPSQQVYEMWTKVFDFYGIDEWSGLFPERNHRSPDWSFETPANSKGIFVKAVGYNQVDKLSKQCTGYVRIKRPNGYDSLERTWELARSEAEAAVRVQRVGYGIEKIYVIVAVDLSAELYSWDTADHTFTRLVRQVLDIFTDSFRECVGLFVRLMESTLQIVKSKMRTLAE